MLWKQTISLAIIILSLSLTLVACQNYEAASFKIEGAQAIMTGAIDGTTPKRVEQLIREHPTVRTIIMQDVEGSVDDEANVVAARLIRQNRFKTHVPANGVIASGGTDFFLAGQQRTIEKGAKLGVHSWANTGDGLTGADIPKDDPQHQLYLRYYEEMDIPSEFYWFTLQAAPADDIHWMTADELVQYQMTTVDF